MSSVRLFAGAARRYWTQVFPAARAAQRELLARARRIPDPLLRADALISHTEKGSNSEGLAALAVLAPRERRAGLARSLVAYQLMLDYLDGVSERPAADPLDATACTCTAPSRSPSTPTPATTTTTPSPPPLRTAAT